MALPRSFTVADLYAMPASDRGERHELINGDLFVNPAPTWRHQLISSKLNYYLTAHVIEQNLGWVNGATGLQIDDRTYVIPDLVFISKNRSGIVGIVNVEAAPDLVCEILSPSTRRQDLITKRALYARIGVREYWLIDPEALSVTVLVREGSGFTELAFAKPGVVVSRVLPGLHLTLDDVFEDIDLVPGEPQPQE